jgi:DNA-binding Lrp family transcriptional regulator
MPVFKPLIRALQQNLPIEPRPFDAFAEQAGVSVDRLLAAARDYLSCGIMRRFSAVLRHREIGMSANAMGVWIVPPELHDSFGETAAKNSSVSHCYLRPSYPDWPYSLFTMVHGKARVDCERELAAISLTTGIKDYTSLYSTHEFKKVRVKYFTRDVEQWESTHELLQSSNA